MSRPPSGGPVDDSERATPLGPPVPPPRQEAATLMLTDVLAVAGLIALVLVWLAAQRLGVRHGPPGTGAFRCGACRGDCGGSRPDCPLGRPSAAPGAHVRDDAAGSGRDEKGWPP